MGSDASLHNYSDENGKLSCSIIPSSWRCCANANTLAPPYILTATVVLWDDIPAGFITGSVLFVSYRWGLFMKSTKFQVVHQ